MLGQKGKVTVGEGAPPTSTRSARRSLGKLGHKWKAQRKGMSDMDRSILLYRLIRLKLFVWPGGSKGLYCTLILDELWASIMPASAAVLSQITNSSGTPDISSPLVVPALRVSHELEDAKFDALLRSRITDLEWEEEMRQRTIDLEEQFSIERLMGIVCPQGHDLGCFYDTDYKWPSHAPIADGACCARALSQVCWHQTVQGG